jgi:membrane protein implicated in regulation of membrane protease activity
MRTDVLVWGILSLLLVAAEVLAPGAFLLWLGIAAGATCLIVLLVPGLPPLVQVVAFVGLAFASIAVYRRFFRAGDAVTDQPLLNRKTEHFVGRHYLLESPIVDGTGRIKVGDAFWMVTGPDLPAGTRVRVVSVGSMTLEVVPEP